MDIQQDDMNSHFEQFWNSVREKLIFKDRGMSYRFLKAFNFDAAQASEHLIKADLRRPINTPNIKLTLKQQQFIESSLISKVVGTTKTGEPILFIKVLNTDVSIFRELFDEKTSINMIRGFMEYTTRDLLPDASKQANREVFHLSIAVDLKGLNISSIIKNPRMLLFARDYASIVSNDYPELADRILVFNAGVLATTAFNVFSPLFPSNMTRLVRCFKAEPPIEEFNFIPMEVLPSEYTGNFKGSLIDIPEPKWLKPNWFFKRVGARPDSEPLFEGGK